MTVDVLTNMKVDILIFYMTVDMLTNMKVDILIIYDCGHIDYLNSVNGEI